MKHKPELSVDILIPKPKQVPAGKKREGALNARFTILMAVTLHGVTDKRLLRAARQDGHRGYLEGKVRLDFALEGNVAFRKTDGTIEWRFAKSFGNATNGRANHAFRSIISQILEGDAWVQTYCTHLTKSLEGGTQESGRVPKRTSPPLDSAETADSRPAQS